MTHCNSSIKYRSLGSDFPFTPFLFGNRQLFGAFYQHFELEPNWSLFSILIQTQPQYYPIPWKMIIDSQAQMNGN